MIIQGSHAPCPIPYHTFFPNRMLIGKLMYPLRLSKTYPQKFLSPPRFPFWGTETFLTVKECFFLPLRLSCKESSTFLTKPLFNSLYAPFGSPSSGGQKPQEREDVAGYAIASARVLVSSAEPVP